MRVLLVIVLALTCALGLGQGTKAPENSQGKAYRKKNSPTPLEQAKLTAEQTKKIDAITKKYDKPYSELLKKLRSGADVGDSLDELNQKYSKELLAVMNKQQKQLYLEAVYRHIKDFLKAKPEYEFEDVFIWGGAYASRPKNDPDPPVWEDKKGG